MCVSLKRINRILVSIAIIFFVLNLNGLSWSQSVGSDSRQDKTATASDNKASSESPSDRKENALAEETKKMDQIGEKVGQQIDDITRQASSHIG